MNFLKSFQSSLVRGNFVRYYGKHNKKYLYQETDKKKYESVTYYPSKTNLEDINANTEIPKLFKVTRVKLVKGNPYWEKRILRDLGLFENGAVAIVKNIPENNARLWKIKHLIKIHPITFPHGVPNVDDVNYTFLKDNGQCIVSKKIEIPSERIQISAEFRESETRMDGESLRKDSRLKWLNNW